MGALLPTRQTAPCIKPQGGLSPPVQQSRKLPSDAVRVPPSVASLLLIQRRMGLPFQCSRPTAPFGRSVTPPSVISSCAARSVADGAPTPGAAEPLAPFGCNGSPSSDASNRALHQAARGTLPSGAAEPQAPFGRSESPSISRVSFAYPASDGAPLPVQQTHGSLRSQCDASVCHFELRCALGGGRGSHLQCSRAAGSLRL